MIEDLLISSSRKFPSRPALLMDDQVVTYERLGTMAACLASRFRSEGLSPGEKVLILWDNGPEYAAVFFGVLMAGGVAVPLNPSNTPESVRYVAEHCSARFVAVTERAVPLLREWWRGAPIMTGLEGGEGSIALQSAIESGAADAGGAGGRGRNEDDLAMILYTSGSTGKPKGVMLSHGNLECNRRSILGYLHLLPGDRTLAILPFYYSYGNSLLLTHAAAGSALVVENGFAFIGRCIENMRKSEVTGVSGVPSHFSVLLNRSRFLDQDWPRLRYMTCAGGSLPPPFIQKIRKSLPHVEIYAMYGQTEAAARLSSLDPSLIDRKIGSVGRGIPGVELRVVNESDEDCRPNEIGEIIARGGNIMQGYLGDVDGTQEVLRHGWLHTGDLATVDEEGFIYIRGRAKEFIKSGGYRIGPMQVEEVLLQHPLVAECAVVGVPDDYLEEKIVACVVLRKARAGERDLEQHKDALTRFARGKLPYYMAPSTIRIVEALPKGDTGKLQRIRLRQMVIDAAEPK